MTHFMIFLNQIKSYLMTCQELRNFNCSHFSGPFFLLPGRTLKPLDPRNLEKAIRSEMVPARWLVVQTLVD